MTLSQIKRFESLNDIFINVYIIEAKRNSSITAHRPKEEQTHQSLVHAECNDNTGHFARIYFAL